METDRQDPQGPPLPPEAAQQLIDQVFAIWINPEIERRRADGLIGDSWPFIAAQIIFNVGTQSEVRLNDQVQIVLQVRATRPIEKGELIRAEDFSDIVGGNLTNSDPNAGHVSIFLHRDTWYLVCDFRYNAQRIRDELAAVDEFIGAAAHCLAVGYLRPALDSLHIATERLAKGFLLLLPDKRVLESRRHGFILENFSLHSYLGNAPSEYAKLLKALQNCSADARYSTTTLKYGAEQVRLMLETARAMRQELSSRVPREPVQPEA